MFEHTPTASFHTGVRGKITMGKFSHYANRSDHQAKASSKSRPCTYCKGNHSAIKCTVVVGPKIRKSIVSKLGLCYNCLSTTHLNAKCTSKYRCRHCGSKHHTTICEKRGTKVTPLQRMGPHLQLMINRNKFMQH